MLPDDLTRARRKNMAARKTTKKRRTKKRRGTLRPSKAREARADKVRLEFQGVGRAATAILRSQGFEVDYRTHTCAHGLSVVLEVSLYPRYGNIEDLTDLQAAVVTTSQAAVANVYDFAGDPEGANYGRAYRALEESASRFRYSRERARAMKAACFGDHKALHRLLATMDRAAPLRSKPFYQVGIRFEIQTAGAGPSGSPTIDRGSDTIWVNPTRYAPHAFEGARAFFGNSETRLAEWDSSTSISRLVVRLTWKHDGTRPHRGRR